MAAPGRVRTFFSRLGFPQETLPANRAPAQYQTIPHAVALVSINQECKTIWVNKAHWFEFGSQFELGSQYDDDEFQPRCHCEQIRALDILDPVHCTLQRLWNHARSTKAPAVGIEFAKLQPATGHHSYAIYHATVTPQRNGQDNEALIELISVKNLTIKIDNPVRSEDKCVITYTLINNGVTITRQTVEVPKHDARRYFDVDQRLATAQERLSSNGIEDALIYLRSWVYDEKNDMKYPERVLLEKLCTPPESAQELQTRLQRQRARLFDGPMMATCYQTLTDTIKKHLKPTTFSADQSPIQSFEYGMATADTTSVEDRLTSVRMNIVRDSDDLELRYEYARILRDRGEEEHARFIETQLALARGNAGWEKYQALLDLEHDEEQYGNAWSGFATCNLPPDVTLGYRNGFVEHVSCSTDFLQDHRLTYIAQHTPLRHLTVQRGTRPFTSLPSDLTDLRSLALDSCNMTDDDISSLIAGPVNKLVWLSIAYNPVGMTGIEHLAHATKTGILAMLQYVDLLGCAADPREQVSVDHDALTDARLPAAGRELEKQYGKLPWLHLTCNARLRETNRYALVEATAPVMVCR